ncbi:SCO2322 family protein [Wenjunlia tyrosinilytica]|uniref:Secreted protein n=1 Tax=Wenjunlia tyrosinilytica TaxID=1544741 RepID=A0A917ZCG7_9ACTN|nr:SCO2322 family protein [Wenjunlia tyrosinilytica]GGO80296.1 hypothetical protein GCM10012280_01870 [Wenjunlia tyrosinilytica]
MRARTGAMAATAAGLLLALLATASPASATGYRYWSFWQAAKGTWAYAQQGPATVRPSDGDVDGWRFAVSEDSSAEAARPRGRADFASICAGTPARHGSKRVAVVLDFGTAADASGDARPPKPRTECARVREDATSADVLATVAKPLRYNSNALLCALAGYPASGCGETVSSTSSTSGSGAKSGAGTGSGPGSASGSASGAKASRAEPASSNDDGPSAGLWVGLAAVAVLAAAGLWQARRRRV